jgi:hypothetical protein
MPFVMMEKRVTRENYDFANWDSGKFFLRALASSGWRRSKAGRKLRRS